MTTQGSITPPHGHTASEEIEEAATIVGVATAVGLRTVEVVTVGLLALLVCPPIFILIVVVVVPLAAIALLVSLIAAALATPFLLVRHLRGHRSRHPALLAHRLRHAAHAIRDLLPHRIVIDARRHGEHR